MFIVSDERIVFIVAATLPLYGRQRTSLTALSKP